MNRLKISLAAVVLLSFTSAFAARVVPSQYATLQEAVSASLSGDTIVIEPGVYGGSGFVDVQVDGITLTILSSAGPDSTVFQLVDANDETALRITDTAGLGQTVVMLEGLQFKNGHKTIICGRRIGLSLKNCEFINCAKGIYDTSYVTEMPNVLGSVDSCYFSQCGVAIDVTANSDWLIRRSVFAYCNWAGMFYTDSGLVITDNVFAFNGEGFYLSHTDSFMFKRNLFIGNNYAIFEDLWTHYVDTECNDFYENQNIFWILPDPVGTNGNFSADPLFCDNTYKYPLVMSTSPLLPANNSCGVNIGNVSVGCICADIDNSGSSPDISDLTYLVDYMFSGGTPPVYINTADLDGIDGVNISDLTFFVDYLFGGGDPPGC
ncbi:MAG: right-handed parallel beta-helix repeat-containing protein [bacterium]|nr:right-handed parallel beta-helix repeat-containing protein [bacterium]